MDIGWEKTHRFEESSGNTTTAEKLVAIVCEGAAGCWTKEKCEMRKIKGKIYERNLRFYKNNKGTWSFGEKFIKPNSIPSHFSKFWGE